MIEPNFFIVGGPKCGTSAIAAYLADHPSVFMANPTEPFYLADELRPIASRQGIDTFDDYMGLFKNSEPDKHKVVGEKSTLYLSSPSALQTIKEKFPNAKIVAMIRDPISVAHAFHMQLYNGFHEDVADFEAAWNLQDARSQGLHIPPHCLAPRLLQYRDIASFSHQLKRLHETFPPQQVMTVSFDQLKNSPRETHVKLLNFLELADDDRTTFPKINEANISRSRALEEFYLLNPVVRKIVRSVKRALPNRIVANISAIKTNIIRKPAKRKPISPEFRAKLQEELAQEIEFTSTYFAQN